MKKIIISIMIVLIICMFGSFSIKAFTNSFTVNTEKLFESNNDKKNIANVFDKSYNLSYSIKTEDSELDNKITDLTKKTTYLLLGNNYSKESQEEYYERYKTFMELRYAPKIPLDKNGELDLNSEEAKQEFFTGFIINNMFTLLNEREIKFKNIKTSRIIKSENGIYSAVKLENAEIKVENKENPMEYVREKKDVTILYLYKELNGEYKLYYIYGMYDNALNEYLDDVEDSETNKSFSIKEEYNESVGKLYDFSKLNKVKEETLTNIYSANNKNIVTLNAYYNNANISSANGFFIKNGLIVTTWNFMEKALINAQYIGIKNNEGTVYELDGIVTVNPEADLVVLKLKNSVLNEVKLGNLEQMKFEDPVFTISSKSGLGLTLQKGILISKDKYIESTIPLTEADQGSPVFNENGEVIGINTSKTINSAISTAIKNDGLKEIQNIFDKKDFNSIKVVKFEKLKEKYYTNYKKENVINSIPTDIWKKYSEIGEIESSINLNLVKAYYVDNALSLRYFNATSEFISSMQLAINFKDNLVKQGYKTILESESKCIYSNGKYKVVIMDEFDYLIVLVVMEK